MLCPPENDTVGVVVDPLDEKLALETDEVAWEVVEEEAVVAGADAVADPAFLPAEWCDDAAPAPLPAPPVAAQAVEPNMNVAPTAQIPVSARRFRSVSAIGPFISVSGTSFLSVNGRSTKRVGKGP